MAAPRIVILGNCQAASHRRLFSVLVPGASVLSFTPAKAEMPVLAGAVRDADLVFAQRFEPALESALCDASGTSPDGFHPLPRVAFTGYHPDCVYLPGIRAAGTGLASDYNSAIAVAGFLSGRSPAETGRLYNSYVCAAAGYFDRFAEASTALDAHFSDLGHDDLTGRIGAWASRGAFMHTINHPRIDVLAEIALAAARRAGLAEAGLIAPDSAPPKASDMLGKSTRWPVYPPVAARLGLTGSLRLVRRHAANPMDMDWADYLRQCHAIYPGLNRADLHTPEVEAILNLID